MRSLLFALLSTFSLFTFAGDVTDISADEFLAADRSDWLVLDVRTTEEYQSGHVPGARNVPVNELEQHLEALSSHADKPVVVYCRSGRRAGVAAELLIKNNFKQVKHLDGDMLGWSESGHPVEH